MRIVRTHSPLLRPAIGLMAAGLALTACGGSQPAGLQTGGASDLTGLAGAAGQPGSGQGDTPGGQGSGGGSGSVSPDRCDGTLPAVSVEDVEVPSGARCILDGTRVSGNVIVRPGGALETRGARVGGNVQAEAAREVTVAADSWILGNLQVDGRAAVAVERSTVDGDIQLVGAGVSLIAASYVVGGDVQVKQAEQAALHGGRIDGNLQLEENRGALRVGENAVRGDLQVFENTGGVSLVSNRIAQNLQCKENRPAPVGRDNRAGSKEDQCARL